MYERVTSKLQEGTDISCMTIEQSLVTSMIIHSRRLKFCLLSRDVRNPSNYEITSRFVVFFFGLIVKNRPSCEILITIYFSGK